MSESGCRKRKRKREKEEREASLLRHVPSIKTFFKRSQGENQGEQVEDDEQTDQGPQPGVGPQPTPEPNLSESEASCSSSTPWIYQVSDPALWGAITEDGRAVLIDRGPAAFHNRRSKYPASNRDDGLGGKVRSLTNDLLCCQLPNGEKVSRDWITYSPSTGNIFCFACMLFSTKRNQFVSGFSDWKHPERVREHEKSTEHCNCNKK